MMLEYVTVESRYNNEVPRAEFASLYLIFGIKVVIGRETNMAPHKYNSEVWKKELL